MRGDSAIWRACMEGRPDWFALSGECGMSPMEAMNRSVELGAWWFIRHDPDSIVRGDKAVRAGLPPGRVAEAMGSDVHTALILMGLRSGYGR